LYPLNLRAYFCTSLKYTKTQTKLDYIQSLIGGFFHPCLKRFEVLSWIVLVHFFYHFFSSSQMFTHCNCI